MLDTGNSRARLWPWFIGLFLLHILPFATRPALIGGDEAHYALMAHSMGAKFDVEIADDYDAVEAGSKAAGLKRAGRPLDRHTRSINGRDVFAHPLGLPLLAAPLIAIQQSILPGSPPDILFGVLTLLITCAALIAAWQLVSLLMGSTRDGALLVFCAYFGSPLWFYSRTFFTEPYTWSFAVLATFCIVRGRLAAAAVFLALTLAMKETALVLVVPILAVSAYRLGVRKAAVLFTGPLTFALLFALKNYLIAGTPFSTFHPYIIGDPIAGVLGLLFDPTHGLVWFAPLLVAGMAGWLRGRTIPVDLRIAAFAAFAGYFAITAAWADWRGGSSYATRLLLPALPFLVVPLANLVASSSLARRLVFPLFLFGFIVNWRAAMDPFHAFWGVSAVELLTGKPAVLVAGLGVGAFLYFLVAKGFPQGAPTADP